MSGYPPLWEARKGLGLINSQDANVAFRTHRKTLKNNDVERYIASTTMGLTSWLIVHRNLACANQKFYGI